MSGYRRYAVYLLPEGGLARFGAAWLGWDAGAGRRVAHPEIGGLPRPVEEITATPRKYGLHATIKPPFRLAEGSSPETLEADLAALCAGLAPVRLEGLELAGLGGFLALVPRGPVAALEALAARAVTGLDRHRAPLTQAETNRRRDGKRLSAVQEALLRDWGYPYVLSEFRCHITLTGRLTRAEAGAVQAALAPHLAPLLPAPCVIDSLCRMGEEAAGMVHLIRRFALTGV